MPRNNRNTQLTGSQPTIRPRRASICHKMLAAMIVAVLDVVATGWAVSAEPRDRVPANEKAAPGACSYSAPRRKIVVDGDSADWKGVPEVRVTGPEQLWFGQGMVRENRRDAADLSYT
jgi:hypothetical protein